jgi:hypothetical protein
VEPLKELALGLNGSSHRAIGARLRVANNFKLRKLHILCHICGKIPLCWAEFSESFIEDWGIQPVMGGGLGEFAA